MASRKKITAIAAHMPVVTPLTTNPIIQPKLVKSDYRKIDEQLRDDILKLVQKHSKKQDKILKSIKLKHKETPNSFEITDVEMSWQFHKPRKNG